MIDLFAQPVTEFPFEVSLSVEDPSKTQKAPQSVNVHVAGQDSRILIGAPQATDLWSHWPAGSHHHHIYEERQEFDYLEVRLACSFVPARGTLFSWARLDADLIGPQGSNHEPLVHDLFPRAVSTAVRYSRHFSVTPTLKLSFVEVSAKAESETESLKYEPELDAAGLLTSTPSWTFQSAQRAGLRGSYELFAIVRVPKETSVHLRMNATAEARGRFGPIPLRRTGGSCSENIMYELRGLP